VAVARLWGGALAWRGHVVEAEMMIGTVQAVKLNILAMISSIVFSGS